ncbi:MAG: TerC family protein [Bacteroidales bacterium]|nr:TerC family protein [Bacteroidales bacterium]
MELSGMPLWAWILFYVLVLIMLVADLKMFGKKGQHEVNVGEALRMTGVWIGVSLLFCVGIYFFYPHDPHEKALEFLSGYLIEKSLSMDNLFVFLMLFSFFGVDRKYQHEVLFWGIFGALILRSIFIFAGAAIVERFDWVLGLFGLFLLYTGAKMFSGNNDQQSNPSNNVIVKWFKKLYLVTEGMRDDKFFVIENGKRFATPLFITLIVIETTDVAFAVDSIPAVFSVSRDPFIVLTSNIFAILGLRALYFALAAVSQYFKYLKYGLGVILIFIGIKMLLEMDGYVNAVFQHFGYEIAVPHIEIPTPVSLIVIFSVLGLSMALSAIIKTKEK